MLSTTIRSVLIRERHTILMFLVTGIFTALIYYSIFAILWQYLNINYQTSFSIAYGVAILFHFSFNRRFTFNAHGRNLYKHLQKYLLMLIINYCSNLAILYAVVEVRHSSPYFGIMLSIIVNINSNFLMSRFWVFENKNRSIKLF